MVELPKYGNVTVDLVTYPIRLNCYRFWRAIEVMYLIEMRTVMLRTARNVL